MMMNFRMVPISVILNTPNNLVKAFTCFSASSCQHSLLIVDWRLLFNGRYFFRLFYTAFLDVGTLGEGKISDITEESYRAMTSNGDVKLDFHIYKLSFLNFLLGKQPNGPGQFIFGSVVPKVKK